MYRYYPTEPNLEFERRILKVALRPKPIPISVFNKYYHPLFFTYKKLSVVERKRG